MQTVINVMVGQYSMGSSGVYLCVTHTNVWGGGVSEKSQLGELLAEWPVKFVEYGRNTRGVLQRTQLSSEYEKSATARLLHMQHGSLSRSVTV